MDTRASVTLALFLVLGCGSSTSGSVGGEVELETQQWRQQFAERIALCMTAAGFEYFPDPDDIPDVSSGLLAAPPVGRGEYGIARPALEIVDLDRLPDPSPNDHYAASLSPAERAAYDAALLGSASTRSCPEQAFYAIEGIATPSQATLEETLQLDRRIVAHPRYVDAETVWARCMDEHGFEFDDRNHIVEFLDAAVDAALAPALEDEGVIEEGSDVEKQMADTLDRVLEQERRIALADSTCSAAHMVGVIEELEALLREDPRTTTAHGGTG